MQVERRQNPYPYTWEIPVGVLAAWALLLVLGVHLGRGIATWFAGAGWHWPEPTGLFTSLPAVLAGDANAGLAMGVAGSVGSGQVLGWVITVEAVLLLAGITVAAWSLRRWGPGRLRGMATAAAAEASLGSSRLRRVRAIIRPDRYARNHPTGPEATS